MMMGACLNREIDIILLAALWCHLVPERSEGTALYRLGHRYAQLIGTDKKALIFLHDSQTLTISPSSTHLLS